MAASRKQATVWSAEDLGVDADSLQPKVETQELYVPTQEQDCEYIEGDSDAEKGHQPGAQTARSKTHLTPQVARRPWQETQSLSSVR